MAGHTCVPFGLHGSNNRTPSISGPEVVKGIPSQGVDCFLARAGFSVSLLCLGCMWCFASVLLVVNTSALNCLKTLISEMTYCVSNGTLNLTHCTHSQHTFVFKFYLIIFKYNNVLNIMVVFIDSIYQTICNSTIVQNNTEFGLLFMQNRIQVEYLVEP